MKFRCNIGLGGRLVRIGVGIVLVADAYLLHRYKMPDDQWWSLALQIVLAAFGAFTIFEGAVGWCAVRALGIRTRF
ncbi:MAG: YgaP family membrane protein [Candidatus Sumerlaeaceae bacterium]|jgi:GT2 family glycosyltransferase